MTLLLIRCATPKTTDTADSGASLDGPQHDASVIEDAPTTADAEPDAKLTDDRGADTTIPEDTAFEDAADVKVCPEPPSGCDALHVATDTDGDECSDACCVQECPPDFVVADYNQDGCGDSCGDAPCDAETDCSVYVCAFYEGQCDTPKGICSNAACSPTGPVCGCDGVTYETGCLANGAGVPVAKAEPCEGAPCDLPTSSSTLLGVGISTTASTPCTFTLAEVAAGVEIPYAVHIGEDVPGVTVTAGAAGACAQPGESGLIVFEKLDGDGQSYCLCDQGKCAPPAATPVTLKAGTTVAKFAWDGKNWFGPSDTGNPKGAPFPPGKYTLHLSAQGTLNDLGWVVEATLPVTLVP